MLNSTLEIHEQPWASLSLLNVLYWRWLEDLRRLNLQYSPKSENDGLQSANCRHCSFIYYTRSQAQRLRTLTVIVSPACWSNATMLSKLSRSRLLARKSCGLPQRNSYWFGCPHGELYAQMYQIGDVQHRRLFEVRGSWRRVRRIIPFQKVSEALVLCISGLIFGIDRRQITTGHCLEAESSASMNNSMLPCVACTGRKEHIKVEIRWVRFFNHANGAMAQLWKVNKEIIN